MGLTTRKWQDELVGFAWVNIGLVVMSLPLFSIYIVESLQDEDVKNFVLHSSRGQHFVEIIIKYFAALMYWVPISILLKIGATKPSYTIIKGCSIAHLLFIFLLALQMIVEPPNAILVVCAYAICSIYLLASVWIMKNFMEELKSGDEDDLMPVIDSENNNIINSSDNFDELNDVADQRFVFRLQPILNKSSRSPKI